MFFMPQNSLLSPSLSEQSFSVANESCRGHKKQQKTIPHPLPLINKLQSPHEIKCQTINQATLTIQNSSTTTPWFQFDKGRWQFPFVKVKMSVKKCPKKFPNVRTKLRLLGQNVRSKFQSSWNPELYKFWNTPACSALHTSLYNLYLKFACNMYSYYTIYEVKNSHRSDCADSQADLHLCCSPSLSLSVF